MAVSITQQPTGIYPAYNDSYLIWTSGLSSDLRTEISISGLSQTFNVYPDANGQYVFNLKNAVRSLINNGSFKDQDITYPAAWTESYGYGYLSISVTLTDYNAGGSGTPSVNYYTFIRGAKQIGEVVHSNPYQLLHPSTNGVDYNLTYFEGYPFSFEIMRMTAGEDLVIRNLNSSDATAIIPVGSTATRRIYVDKATSNWTSASYLPLTDTINRLEIEVDLSVKVNINIKKVPNTCGVYLKWFNQDGGYSYWLFEQFWKEETSGKDIGFVSSNDYSNVGSFVSPIMSTGRTASKSYNLKTKANDKEIKHLESLFISPSVQMYTQTNPYEAGTFTDVILSGSLSNSNKKSINTVKAKITLPELVTAML